MNGRQHGTGVLTTQKDGNPVMGIWEKGKHVRWLTKEDIEQLEQQQQELMYGEEGEEGEEGEQEDDESVEPGSREVVFRSDLQLVTGDNSGKHMQIVTSEEDSKQQFDEYGQHVQHNPEYGQEEEDSDEE